MIKAFIHIRYKQIIRGLIEIGLIRIVFLAVLLAMAGVYVYSQTIKMPNSMYVSAVTLITLALIQLKRQDKTFLRTHFYYFKRVLYAEYLIISVPIVILQIIHLQWFSIVLLIVVLILIVHFDFQPKPRSLNTKVQQLIPQYCFEWKAGIRKSLFVIVPIWVLGLGVSFYIGTVPAVIFILGVLPLGFYENNESRQMVLVFEKNAKRFLFQKIKLQLTLFSIIAFPLIIAFVIFHPAKWYIPLGEYLIFSALHIYLIFTKYAFYEPNRKSSATQMFGAIGVVGAIIPFFLPVVVLLAVRFYYKSIENLSFYLNDYN